MATENSVSFNFIRYNKRYKAVKTISVGKPSEFLRCRQTYNLLSDGKRQEKRQPGENWGKL